MTDGLVSLYYSVMEEGNSKDSNNLLLLGLELLKNLNKSSKTKLPYAVVKPRVQTPSEEPNTVESLENNIAMSRKRKRSDETTEMDRKEKRYVKGSAILASLFKIFSQEDDE